MKKKKIFVVALLAFALIGIISLKFALEATAATITRAEIPAWDVELSHTGGTGSMEPTWYGSAYLVKSGDTSDINRFDIVVAEPTEEQRYYTSTGNALASYYLQQNGYTDDTTIQQVEDGHCLVKRIIGLPGDTLWIYKHHLYIIWERVDEEYDWYIDDPKILRLPYTLGDDEYFIMGDNRTKGGSYDSRFFGAITYDQINYEVIGIIVDVDSETLTDRINDANVVKFAKYDDGNNTYLVDIYGEYSDWDYGDIVAVLLGDDDEISTYRLVGKPGDEIEISGWTIFLNGEKTDFYQTDIGLLKYITITLGENEYYVVSADGSTGKVAAENEIVGEVVASVS